MRNKLLMTAVLATVLVSCAKDSELVDNSINPAKTNTEAVVTKQPVQFGAYVNRAVTRAGDPGTLVTSGDTEGQVSLQEKGFGVIAYYTDDDLYSPIYQPNFMYNTWVHGTDWEYTPVQYWPNETGDNAVSEGVDRLSFFAYAPYVDVTSATGIVEGDATSGIVGLSRNGAVGDPFVKYYVSLDPAKQVDFSWGTPHIDMTKQAVNEKVSFVFNHALAALNVQVDAAIDELTPGNNTLRTETRIYVRSITFEGFVTKGAFNLNTSKATWYDLAGANYIDGGSVTVYDGRTNGREGQSESVNEAPQGLNPVIVQDVPYSDTALQTGVTETPVNLFNGSSAAPIYVIPSGQPLKVTIVYDVETATDELAGYLSDGETHGTSVENKIAKAISFGTSNKLEAGKLYNLTLHLGMTSVKFDATVAEWDESTAGGSADLPKNLVGIGSVNLTLGGNNFAYITRWVNDTDIPMPDVTVKDAEGNELTDGVTYEWSSSDENVATVHPSTGEVTPVGPGTTTITVKATYNGTSKTASYPFNVNAVTGISVAPSPLDMIKGSTSSLTVTLTHTTNAVVNLPANLDYSFSPEGVVTLGNPVKATTGGTTTYTYPVTSSANINSTTATFTPGSAYTSIDPASVVINVLDNPSATNNATGQGFTWDN